MNISTSFALHQLQIEMDRVADTVLQKHLGLSYSRFYFLLTVDEFSGVTQHAVAELMSISDAAVSRMLRELSREGLVVVAVDPAHQRRRTVSLSEKGSTLLQESLTVLDDCFSDVAARSSVLEDQYREQTLRLTNHMKQKYKEES